MNCQINWAAVEALATVGALIFLGYQLILFRKEIVARKQEIVARKVEGFKYAREQLESEDFQGWSKVIIDWWKLDGDKYPEEIEGYIVYAVGRIDFVAKLIELDYLDQDLLFYLFADVLWSIERAITNFDHRDNSRIPSLRARFPRGFDLLKEASKAASDNSKEAFDRLDEQE